MSTKIKKSNQSRTLFRAQVIAAAAVATVLSSSYGLADITLNNGSLSFTVRSDNGAIKSAIFGGKDFFNPGTPVSNWGLQAGVDTSTFALNSTVGGIGTPVTVSGSGSSATVAGTFALGGVNFGFTRRYDLIAGQNAVRVTTAFTNNAATSQTLSYFDTFDPDQDDPASYYTFNDVYTSGSTRLARGSASSNGTAGGTPALSFVIGTNDASATLAAGSPFALDSGTTLNSFFASPFDGNGAFVDAGVHVGLQKSLAAGGSYTFATSFAFGVDPASANAAAIASLAGGGGNWLNATNVNNAWSTASNWGGGSAPTSADDAIFNLASTYAINVATPATANAVVVNAGDVTLNLTGQTLALASRINIDAASEPKLTINGGTVTINNGQRISVGQATKGEFVAQGGATITAQHLILGDDSSAAYGKATITGPGTNVTLTGQINAGDSGSGDLYVNNGAQLTATEQTDAGVTSGQRGYVVVGGGANASSLTTGKFVAGGYYNTTTSAYVDGGTGEIYVLPGGTISATETNVLNDLSIINLQGGTLKTTTLNLGNTASRLNWTAGTLSIGGTNSFLGSSLGVPNGGTLMGTGWARTVVNVASGGHMSPGDGVGKISVGTNGSAGVSLAAGSMLDIELAGTASNTFDVLNVFGAVTLGGDLNLALLGGLSPAMGDSWTIITNDATDAITGRFANTLTVDATHGLLYSGGLTYGLDYAGGTGNDLVLSVVPEPSSLAGSPRPRCRSS